VVYLPLWKILVNGKDSPIYLEKKHAWNHQPVIMKYGFFRLKNSRQWSAVQGWFLVALTSIKAASQPVLVFMGHFWFYTSLVSNLTQFPTVIGLFGFKFTCPLKTRIFSESMRSMFEILGCSLVIISLSQFWASDKFSVTVGSRAPVANAKNCHHDPAWPGSWPHDDWMIWRYPHHLGKRKPPCQL
jgi:hypothetical protein